VNVAHSGNDVGFSISALMPYLIAMQLSTDMFAHDIGRALDWVGSQVGTRVEKRVKAFNAEERRNPAIHSYYRNTYQIEYALAHAWRQYRKTGIFPESNDFSIAYAFAGMTQRIYENLSLPGQKRLRGCLEDGAKGEYGFRPLSYEMTMASRLSRSGYDLECVDLERQGRFDFLATKHKIAFEMECKTTSPDNPTKVARFIERISISLATSCSRSPSSLSILVVAMFSAS
jgi:hypothetical protein